MKKVRLPAAKGTQEGRKKPSTPRALLLVSGEIRVRAVVVVVSSEEAIHVVVIVVQERDKERRTQRTTRRIDGRDPKGSVILLNFTHDVHDLRRVATLNVATSTTVIGDRSDRRRIVREFSPASSFFYRT